MGSHGKGASRVDTVVTDVAAGHVAIGTRMPRRLRHARSIEDLRVLARRRLPRAVFEFFDGGAEDESTLRDNRAAFERWRLVPRMMVGVGTVDTATEIAGSRANWPIVIAPTGAPGFAWPRADIAIARAAATFGIPYTLSSSATCSLEDVAREAAGAPWFQPYILRDRPFFARLIDRAEVAGYQTLVLTVDMPTGGKRERDFRNDFGVPFHWTARNVCDFASRPAWAMQLIRNGVPRLENLIGLDRSGPDISGAASSVGRNYDPDFDWRGFEAIRKRWPRTLLVKGILHPDDAHRAVELGAQGLIVSNHGGRQLDGAIASLDALLAIVAAVGDRVPVIVDSGVRRGSDIVKARALGATAVMIGRATLYGAAAGGAAGAQRALEILTEEIVRTMRLCGMRSLDDLGRGWLVRQDAQPPGAAMAAGEGSEA